MATFVLGYLLGSYEKKIPNWLLVLGAAVMLAVISVGTWLLTVRTGEFNQNFQNQSSGFEIVLAACIFLLCKQTCNRPPRAWVRAAMGSVVSLSMAIYLMHNIFLSMLYSVGVSPRSFGGTVGVTLLVFAACFAVTKTVATVRPLLPQAKRMLRRAAAATGYIPSAGCADVPRRKYKNDRPEEVPPACRLRLHISARRGATRSATTAM